MKRSTFLKLAIGMLAASASIASQAQSSNPIRVLVGFPAGGAPDAVARAFADQLRQTTGENVIVENRTGASGKIAIDTLLSSPSDGRTVALIPSSIAILVPMTVKAAKYDVAKSFTVLGNVAEYGFGIAAGPASGASDVASFKTWTKAHPKQAVYATPGLGTAQHFLGAEIGKQMGLDLLHVPYRGGAPAVSDLLGGQVPFLITTEQLLVPLHKQGKLKTLFVTSPERNPMLPDVPTAKEVGLAQLEAQDWFGLFAKAGTPADVVQDWQAKIKTVVSSKRYHELVEKMGYSVPSEQFADYTPRLVAERQAWANRVKMSGFSAAD